MDRGAEQRGYKKRKTFRTMLVTQRTDLTVMMFTTFNARCMKVQRLDTKELPVQPCCNPTQQLCSKPDLQEADQASFC